MPLDSVRNRTNVDQCNVVQRALTDDRDNARRVTRSGLVEQHEIVGTVRVDVLEREAADGCRAIWISQLRSYTLWIVVIRQLKRIDSDAPVDCGRQVS